MLVPPITSELATDFKSNHYLVGNMALLQQAVSDRMYKNSHLAVVRELQANGRDAHREAGIEDVPTRISFPSHGDSHLRIKDYGLGVNYERMITSFTGYCASTKTGDNTQTGGFGLGCKTPFSVSQSFMVDTTSLDNFYELLGITPEEVDADSSVETLRAGFEAKIAARHEKFPPFKREILEQSIQLLADPEQRRLHDLHGGIKRRRLWSHHKDAKGLSAYSALTTSDVAPETPTGTEIIIPASMNDRYKFVDAFKKICQWWVPMPITPNEDDAPEPEVLDMWDERTSFHTIASDSHRAIVDGIPYKIPWKLNIVGSVTLWFKTGEIPVTLTRDDLDAEAETVVVARIRDLVEEARTKEPPSLRWALQTSHRLRTTISWPGWDGVMSMSVPDGLRARHWKKEHGRRTHRRGEGPARMAIVSLLEILNYATVVNDTTRVDTTVLGERAEKAGVGNVIYIHRHRKDLGPDEEAFLKWLAPFSTPWTEWEPTIKDVDVVPKVRTHSPKYHYWDTVGNRLIPWKQTLPDKAVYVLRIHGESYAVDRGDGARMAVHRLGRYSNADGRGQIPIIAVRDTTKVPHGWMSWIEYVRHRIKHHDNKIKDLIYGDVKGRDGLSEFWDDLEEMTKKHPNHPLGSLQKLRKKWYDSCDERNQHRIWRGLLGLPVVENAHFLNPETLIPDHIKDLYSPGYRMRALRDMMPPPSLTQPTTQSTSAEVQAA